LRRRSVFEAVHGRRHAPPGELARACATATWAHLLRMSTDWAVGVLGRGVRTDPAWSP